MSINVGPLWNATGSIFFCEGGGYNGPVFNGSYALGCPIPRPGAKESLSELGFENIFVF